MHAQLPSILEGHLGRISVSKYRIERLYDANTVHLAFDRAGSSSLKFQQGESEMVISQIKLEAVQQMGSNNNDFTDKDGFFLSASTIERWIVSFI